MMAKKRKVKWGKWVLMFILGLILVTVLGLIINNRIYALKYSNLSTNAEHLSSNEISAVKGVYEYLDNYGDDIFKDFNANKDVIIYNDSYEFLISNDREISDWNFIGRNEELKKYIHRKKADNPQAFAVYAGEKWVGSMSTKNCYDKFIIKSIPVFFPPQLMSMDEEHYKATIIHEMVHAHEAKHNIDRFLKLKSLHSVGDNYYDNKVFNDLIVQEASYLEQAIASKEHNDVLDNTKKFIEIRNTRRKECKMSSDEIQNEKDLEWLEGLARYAEYKASRSSNSLIAKNLGDIDQKVKVKGDDRYYTLGMAQALVLDKLQQNWKNELFTDNFSLEEHLKDVIEYKE
ncbi:MAG: hypothetical protein C0595_14385 [Marinilabiliales bacterium]|nr:MAG: hypothetical protein C0595_14385 [Marinilabiliales bacterium]